MIFGGYKVIGGKVVARKKITIFAFITYVTTKENGKQGVAGRKTQQPERRVNIGKKDEITFSYESQKANNVKSSVKL